MDENFDIIYASIIGTTKNTVLLADEMKQFELQRNIFPRNVGIFIGDPYILIYDNKEIRRAIFFDEIYSVSFGYITGFRNGFGKITNSTTSFEFKKRAFYDKSIYHLFQIFYDEKKRMYFADNLVPITKQYNGIVSRYDGMNGTIFIGDVSYFFHGCDILLSKKQVVENGEYFCFIYQNNVYILAEVNLQSSSHQSGSHLSHISHSDANNNNPINRQNMKYDHTNNNNHNDGNNNNNHNMKKKNKKSNKEPKHIDHFNLNQDPVGNFDLTLSFTPSLIDQSNNFNEHDSSNCQDNQSDVIFDSNQIPLYITILSRIMEVDEIRYNQLISVFVNKNLRFLNEMMDYTYKIKPLLFYKFLEDISNCISKLDEKTYNELTISRSIYQLLDFCRGHNENEFMSKLNNILGGTNILESLKYDEVINSRNINNIITYFSSECNPKASLKFISDVEKFNFILSLLLRVYQGSEIPYYFDRNYLKLNSEILIGLINSTNDLKYFLDLLKNEYSLKRFVGVNFRKDKQLSLLQISIDSICLLINFNLIRINDQYSEDFLNYLFQNHAIVCFNNIGEIKGQFSSFITTTTILIDISEFNLSILYQNIHNLTISDLYYHYFRVPINLSHINHSFNTENLLFPEIEFLCIEVHVLLHLIDKLKFHISNSQEIIGIQKTNCCGSIIADEFQGTPFLIERTNQIFQNFIFPLPFQFCEYYSIQRYDFSISSIVSSLSYASGLKPEQILKIYLLDGDTYLFSKYDEVPEQMSSNNTMINLMDTRTFALDQHIYNNNIKKYIFSISIIQFKYVILMINKNCYGKVPVIDIFKSPFSQFQIVDTSNPFTLELKEKMDC